MVNPIGSSVQRANKARAKEYKASGNKAMLAGAFQKAMRQYSKALELDPGNAILYSNRSATHFNLRQFAESLEDAESAILCDEKWWKAYKRKGLALIHMQRYEEAIEALEAGLQIIGKNAEMEKNLEFARACQEQAQNLYILPEPHMMERLESVPVFIVTDEAGQPFFVTYEDGQQVCTFYFDKVDADATLKWIQDENPDIGSSARVIHITLNQAFNLAQETQKQYYDETTRAAVEEDLAAARAAAGKSLKDHNATADDVDSDDNDPDKSVTEKDVDDDAEEAEADEEPTSEAKQVQPDNSSTKETSESEGNTDKNQQDSDEALIDENVPLSFQFRPELRQVEVAVELLNKHPNPPVRPILRDPPAVREAKAKAKAEAEARAAAEKSGDLADVKSNPSESAADSAGKSDEKVGVTVQSLVSTESTQQTGAQQTDDCRELVADVPIEGATSAKPQDDSDSPASCNEDKMTEADGTAPVEQNGQKRSAGTGSSAAEIEDDVELSVENFNGIPVFQAKGLTLLQGGKQHIPLFYSKWDLEAAWDHLAASSTAGISGKCEVEVGTLEDVLRRMSESKTGEYENVIFVPSRESMEAIGQKFPLDDLSTRKPPPKPVVKKANYSRAKQIKARGGTREEIRAAIEEDLRLHRERQRMAEMVAQLNPSPAAETLGSASSAIRHGGVGGLGRRSVGGAPIEKPLSGHARRSLNREERSKSTGGSKPSGGGSGESGKPRFSETTAAVGGGAGSVGTPSTHVRDSTIGVSPSS